MVKIATGVIDMVPEFTVVVHGAIGTDVGAGGEESDGGDAGVGIAAASEEEGCDEETVPDVPSDVVEIEGFKLTSNVADERPSLWEDVRDKSKGTPVNFAGGWEAGVLCAADGSTDIADRLPIR